MLIHIWFKRWILIEIYDFRTSTDFNDINYTTYRNTTGYPRDQPIVHGEVFIALWRATQGGVLVVYVLGVPTSVTTYHYNRTPYTLWINSVSLKNVDVKQTDQTMVDIG